MLFKQAKYRLPTAILLGSISFLPLNALRTTDIIHRSPAPFSVHLGSPREQTAVLDSLRQDVAAHPADFITFETESSAQSFIVIHAPDAQLEKEPRVIARGIVGYWFGKTLVVLPSLPTASRL